MMTLEEGDKISTVGRFGTRHFGIFSGCDGAGEGWVIHASKDRMQVVEEPLPTFTEGWGVKVEKRAEAGWSHYVVASARELLGRPYDLVNFNCEHLASFAQDGTAESPQLKRGLWALAGLTFFLVGAAVPAGATAAGVRKLTGYDMNVGRWRDAYGRFK
jgi:hypothetical protein